jgi:cytochrome c oxidase subunit 4
MAHHHNDNPHELDHDPLPAKVYVGVLASLALLTFVTVWIAQYDFGMWTVPIAMLIATIKASLVIMYFKNLKQDGGFNAVAFFAGLFFLLVFTAPTLWDRETRHVVDPDRAAEVHHTRPGYPPQVTGEKPAETPAAKEGEPVAAD